MKTLKNLTLTQKPATFQNDANEVIEYMQYILTVDGRDILVKPVNPVAKIRLADAFEKIK